MDFGKRRKKTGPDKLTAEILMLAVFDLNDASSVRSFRRTIPVGERTLFRYAAEMNLLLGESCFRYRGGGLPTFFANRDPLSQDGNWSFWESGSSLIPQEQVPEKLGHLWRLMVLYRDLPLGPWLYPEECDEEDDPGVSAAQIIETLAENGINVSLRTAQRDRRILKEACRLYQEFRE